MECLESDRSDAGTTKHHFEILFQKTCKGHNVKSVVLDPVAHVQGRGSRALPSPENGAPRAEALPGAEQRLVRRETGQQCQQQRRVEGKPGAPHPLLPQTAA